MYFVFGWSLFGQLLVYFVLLNLINAYNIYKKKTKTNVNRKIHSHSYFHKMHVNEKKKK